MKILIPVDVGYAFDYLAILLIKFSKKIIPYDDVFDCSEEIISQINQLTYDEIICSKEFMDLKLANEETFIAVERAKKDLCSASYVDKCNTNRYLAKISLQTKFFPDAPVTETKT